MIKKLIKKDFCAVHSRKNREALKGTTTKSVQTFLKVLCRSLEIGLLTDVRTLQCYVT